MISTPQPQLPTPPPNPPMFGGDNTSGAGARQRNMAKAGTGFFGTAQGTQNANVLGAGAAPTPQSNVLGT